ncbi:MAG TPA: hypothetical protein VK826_19010, partial [Bacteroidia bacterium]|nr:hypothetical protein [Bacteroidia bacterium]
GATGPGLNPGMFVLSPTPGATAGFTETNFKILAPTRSGSFEVRTANVSPTSLPGVGLSPASNEIFVVGGNEPTGGDATRLVTAYSTNGDSWRGVPSLNTPRMASAVVTYNNYVYAFGGRNSAGVLSTWEGFTIGGSAWAQSNMPWGIFGACAAVVGEWAYVLGGSSVGVTNLNFRMNLSNGTWQRRAAAPQSFSFAQAVTIGTAIYVIGGLNPNGPAPMMAYDTNSDTWFIPPQSGPVDLIAAGVTAYNGIIYVMGGLEWSPLSSIPVTTSVVRAYNPMLNVWSQFPTRLSMPRAALGAVCAANGTLYAVGGMSALASLPNSSRIMPQVAANGVLPQLYPTIDRCSIPDSTFYVLRKSETAPL